MCAGLNQRDCRPIEDARADASRRSCRTWRRPAIAIVDQQQVEDDDVQVALGRVQARHEQQRVARQERDHRARLEEDDEREGGIAAPLDDRAGVSQESDQVVNELHESLDSSRHAWHRNPPGVRAQCSWTGLAAPQPAPNDEGDQRPRAARPRWPSGSAAGSPAPCRGCPQTTNRCR